MAKTVSNEVIISALLTNGTVKETAAALKIAPRTLYDRMSDKEFRAEYAAVRADILRGTVATITAQLVEAVNVVSEIMTDKKVNPATRLQAAQTIIGASTKLKDSLYREEQKIDDLTRTPFDFFYE